MKNSSKFLTFEALTAELEKLRGRGKTIVQSHGMFDRLHAGHFRHFLQASQLGDVLVVTIFPDTFDSIGPTGCSLNESERAEALSFLEWVDYVAVDKEPSLHSALTRLKPDIFVTGRERFKDFRSVSDRTGLAEIMDQLGIRHVFTEDDLVVAELEAESAVSYYSGEVRNYLHFFKTRHSFDELLEVLERLSSLEVLVVGDTILDEYCYCRTLGVSSKSPTLAVQYNSHELFAGGILAIANHVAGFCKKVHLITTIGKEGPYQSFIRSRLKENIEPNLIVQKDIPTLIKRRIIEPDSLNKLLEIYVMDSSGPENGVEEELCRLLEEQMPRHDLVIAGDFGHGAITAKIRKTLTSQAPFLAVNTQANAGNKLVHTISRYSRADYVSITEHELRLETRDLKGDIRPMVQSLHQQLGSRAFVVTRGKIGSCITHGRGGAYTNVPAFATTTVDSIGAGDAFFSISALAAYLDTPPELIAFLGNVVGALAAKIVGNQRAVTKSDVSKYLVKLLQ